MNIIEPRPTEKLLWGMTKQLFSGWVSEKYRPLRINEQNGFTAMFDQRVEFFFTGTQQLLRQLAFGDVLIDTVGFNGSPLIVLDNEISHRYVPDAAIGIEHPVLQIAVELGIFGLHSLANFFANKRSFFGRHKVPGIVGD